MKSIELDAKLKAEEARSKLGCGTEPILDIFTLIEGEGILLIRAPINRESLSAFFLRKKSEFVIFINTSKTLGHQYFSAAHELYHYIYDKDMVGQICNTALFNNNKSENEKMADYFAVNFLMPESSVIRYASKITGSKYLEINDIIKMQQYFKVSYLSMLIRLKELELISPKQYQRLKEIKIISKSRSLGYDSKLLLPTEDKYISPDYIQLAMSLYESGDITYNKLKEYLRETGFDADELLSYKNKEVDEFAEETPVDY